MKKEVKVAIIGGIVTIIVAIITGFFGFLKSRKPEPAPVTPALTAPAPAAQSAHNSGDVIIINGDDNIHAGGNVTIHGGRKR